jgi:predicted heme/steroid binding protein
VKFVAQERKITQVELAENNGKNGKPAYIAYKGRVYDVTNSVFWMDGEHMGTHQAGVDLTSEMELAPHADDVTKRAAFVGPLI